MEESANDVVRLSEVMTAMGMRELPKLKKVDISPTSPAISDPAWQEFRKSLKGLPTTTKLRRLRNWRRSHPGQKSNIQVTNYINALKRAGLVK